MQNHNTGEKYKNRRIPRDLTERGAPGDAARTAPSGALGGARAALDVAQADPAAAIALAAAVLEARPEAPLDAQAVALRAVALARMEQGEPGAARQEIEAAIDCARRAGSHELVAESLITASLVQLACGDGASARACADEAVDLSPWDTRARAEAQRALILQRLGATDDALASYARAIPELLARDDELWTCRALSNRGVLHMYRGNLEAAEADLRRARDLALRIGQDVAAARCEQNLGCTATRRGNLHDALAAFDRAQMLCERSGATTAVLDADRCEALLLGGLLHDAVAVAWRSVAALRAVDAQAELAEAELQLARALRSSDRLVECVEVAAAAERRFVAQRRHSWALVARGLALEARESARAVGLRPRDVGPSTDREQQATMADVLLTAGELATSGWQELAFQLSIAAAAAAEREGNRPIASTMYQTATRAGRHASVELRVLAQTAAVHVHRLARDRTRARTSFGRGARLLDRQRFVMGSQELRVGLSHRHRGLLDAGLAMERELGDVWGAISCVDAMIEVPPAASFATPTDPTTEHDAHDALLDELRSLRLELRSPSCSEPIVVARRAAAIEAAVVASDRATATGAVAASSRRRTRLASRRPPRSVALVVLTREHADIVLRAVCGPRAVALTLDADELLASVDDLVHACGDLAGAGADHTRTNRLVRALELSRDSLAEMIWKPIEAVVGDRPLVVHPGPLAALPFGLVPGFADREMTVTDSIRAALDARRSNAIAWKRQAVFVAGPDLDSADEEVATLSRAHPGAHALVGAGATTSAVLAMADGARLLHIAAHGEFRLDNPLFSSLHLHDGPLHAHELSRLALAPELVVLASCAAGSHSEREGGAIGLARAFVRAGSRCVIAPLLDVADEATLTVMRGVHEELRSGAPPATALLRMRTLHAPTSPAGLAAASFGVFGRVVR